MKNRPPPLPIPLTALKTSGERGATSPAPIITDSVAPALTPNPISLLNRMPVEEEIGTEGLVARIPLKKIIIKKDYQPRLRLNEDHVSSLALAMREMGQSEPVLVRLVEDGYELLKGHHRYEAALREGAETIIALIRILDHKAALILARTSNSSSLGEYEYEKALNFKFLLDEGLAKNQSAVAAMNGVSQAYVSSLLSFHKLPQNFLNLLTLHPHLLGHKEVRVVLTLIDEFPDHLPTVLEGIERLIDGADRNSIGPWVRQAIQREGRVPISRQQQDPVVVDAGGKVLFAMKLKDRSVVVDVKDPAVDLSELRDFMLASLKTRNNVDQS